MKTTEKYFPVVLFIILYKVILFFFQSVDEIIKCDLSKATDHYFHVVLCSVLHNAFS